MPRRYFLACFAMLVSVCQLPAADVARPLETLRREHPRLLFTAERQKEVEKLAKTDLLLKRLIEQNHINATAMLKAPPVKYEIPDGKRLLTQSRKCIERVTAMAMAYRLSGEKKFADAAIREMLITTKFRDFNPRHFLDTAEMTTALAIGYDWLYDEISPKDRKTIRETIVRLGLEPGMRIYDTGGWWVRGRNNWNQVCNGGMVLGALAIAEDEPELATKIVTAGVKSIHNAKFYEPDGAYPEGPGYWQYGTSYTAIAMMGFDTALGRDFGIAKMKALDKTGLFRIYTIGPQGEYFNYADCGKWFRPASTMFALSQTYDNPLYAAWHRRQLTKKIPLEGKLRPEHIDRFFPLEIAWYDPRSPKSAGSLDGIPRTIVFRGIQDIVTMRSDWGPDAVFVGFKGGNNQASHGHLDIGSFVLDAAGVRWALDLGSDNYNMPGYFGGKRWTYYRLNNRSHNTLVIDDKLQNPKAVSRITEFQESKDRVRATVDMTDAYKGQVDKASRTVELRTSGDVYVIDLIENPQGKIRWGMVTAADVKLDGKKAVLSEDGKRLEAEILSPKNAKFEIVSTKPPTSQERQNQGTRMLATLLNPVEGEMRVEIRLRPPTPGDPKSPD